MSIKISCPNCGKRPIEEFVYGELPRVPDHITDTDARDIDRAFMMSNPAGVQMEAWFHLYGCRRWLRLCRDTRTDALVACNETRSLDL
jgi:sarcosine oxidase subunit delta